MSTSPWTDDPDGLSDLALLRSREDLIAAVMSEPGFERRGKKIVSRIAAIDADRARPMTGHCEPPPYAPARRRGGGQAGRHGRPSGQCHYTASE